MQSPSDEEVVVEMAKVKFIGGSDENQAVTELEVPTGEQPPEQVTIGGEIYVGTKQDEDGVWVYLLKPTATP